MSISSLNSTLPTISFYILLAIADRPMYGYGIREQIIEDSEGSLIVATGTLYPSLKRLESTGLIERIDPEGETRRRYRITAYGRRQLASEAKRHGRIAIHTRLKLGEKILAG